MRPILNIDLDGVVYNWHGSFSDFLADDTMEADIFWEDGWTYCHPEPDNWNFYATPGWGAMTFDKFFKNYTAHVLDGGFYDGNIIEGSREALEFLDEKGFYIRIVTHRLQFPGHHGFVQRQTAQWLDDYKVPYHDIIYLGKAADKDAFDCFASLDDKPDNATANSGYLFDRLWNRDVNHQRRVSWQGFVDGVLDGYRLSDTTELSNTSN